MKGKKEGRKKRVRGGIVRLSKDRKKRMNVCLCLREKERIEEQCALDICNGIKFSVMAIVES